MRISGIYASILTLSVMAYGINHHSPWFVRLGFTVFIWLYLEGVFLASWGIFNTRDTAVNPKANS